jgi:hypothetical protein
MPAPDSPLAPTDRARSPEHGGRSPRVPWIVIASLVFLCAMGSLFHELGGVDPREYVIASAPIETDRVRGAWDVMSVNDLRFVVALIHRNAETLVRAPGDLFHLEHCFPQRNALALGEAVIAPSVLGIPFALLGDPLVTFNIVLLVSTLLAAFSMYWLVDEWTGLPAAGIVAGLLYGFHTIRMRDPVHFYVWDNVWTILALLFARRLFVSARWRDAVGLAVCCGMQIAGSFYPLLAAVVIALPLVIWFIASQGVARLRPTQLGFVLIVIGAVAWAALFPYLGLREAGQLGAREIQFFLPFSWLLPGALFFPGAVLLVLALSGMLMPRGADRKSLGGNPRIALFVAGFVCLALATGGSAGESASILLPDQTPSDLWLPNLWTLLARILPGFDVVRAPAALLSGVHTILCILAGLGAAALIRATPARLGATLIGILIVLAYVDTLRPETLGFVPRQRYAPLKLRPEAEQLAFFARLEEMGDRGPIYEVTFPRKLNPRTTEPLLLANYHGRPTSVCYNSFIVRELYDLWNEIDDPSRLFELHEMGFTTLIIHAPRGNADGDQLQLRLLDLQIRTGDRYLRMLASDPAMTAWRITGALPSADSPADRAIR